MNDIPTSADIRPPAITVEVPEQLQVMNRICFGYPLVPKETE